MRDDRGQAADCEALDGSGRDSIDVISDDAGLRHVPDRQRLHRAEGARAAELPDIEVPAPVRAAAVNAGAAALPTCRRAQLGEGYQEPRPIDPFGLAAHGLDPGLGTMLLQGVAEVR